MTGPQENSERRPQNTSSRRGRGSAWKLLENQILKLRGQQIKTVTNPENKQARKSNLRNHKGVPERKGRSRGFRGGARAGSAEGADCSGPSGRVHPPPLPPSPPLGPALRGYPRWPIWRGRGTPPGSSQESAAVLEFSTQESVGWAARGQLSRLGDPRVSQQRVARRSAQLRPRPLRAGPCAQVRGLGWAACPVWSVKAEARMGSSRGLIIRQRNRAECVICFFSTRQNSVGDFGSWEKVPPICPTPFLILLKLSEPGNSQVRAQCLTISELTINNLHNLNDLSLSLPLSVYLKYYRFTYNAQIYFLSSDLSLNSRLVYATYIQHPPSCPNNPLPNVPSPACSFHNLPPSVNGSQSPLFVLPSLSVTVGFSVPARSSHHHFTPLWLLQ